MTTPDAEIIIAATAATRPPDHGQAQGFCAAGRPRSAPRGQAARDHPLLAWRAHPGTGGRCRYRRRLWAPWCCSTNCIVAKSSDLYGPRASLTKRNGQMVVISTAGDDELSPLGAELCTGVLAADPEARWGFRYAATADGSFVLNEWSLDATRI